jgi:hypothetical protein
MRSLRVPARSAAFLALSLFVAGIERGTTAPSPQSKQKAADSTVEVINGDSRRTVTLPGAQPTHPIPRHAISRHAVLEHAIKPKAPRHRRTAHHRVASSSPITAEILNGTQKETRVFSAASAAEAPARNLSPVVIGIASSSSRSRPGPPVVTAVLSRAPEQTAGAAQPVVVHVASSGSSAQPVVLGVASSGFQTAGTVEPVATGVSPRPAKRPPYRPAVLDQQ